jgi:hypothetical protein
MEPPHDGAEGSPHTDGRFCRVPPEGLDNGRAPHGIVRALVGKLHNKVAESKELGVSIPDILESLKVLHDGLDGPDKGVDFGLCKRRDVDVGAGQ